MQFRTFLVGLLLSTGVHAGEAEEPITLQISAERAQQCADGGGCVYVTQAEMVAAMERVWEKAFDAGKEFSYATCGSRTSRRFSTAQRCQPVETPSLSGRRSLWKCPDGSTYLGPKP
jgi:hypothetical protein